MRILASEEGGREAVLALSLNRLIVRMLKVPADQDAVSFATPILQAASPYPDEPLTVSCETVKEGEDGKLVIAGALPESSTDDIAEQLDGAKLNVTRIDAVELGALRGLWPQIVGAGESSAVRRMVLMERQDCVSVIVLDGDLPSAIRAITDLSELKREVMLCLLEAEDFGGNVALKEIVWVREKDSADLEVDLESLAPVRKIEVEDADLPLVGVSERSAEPGTLDVSPDSWKGVLEETRFKAKMIKYLAIAGGIWLLAMGVLFGVPMAYGFMTDYQKNLCKEHRRQYEAVKAMKGKVDLVRKYSDHARGALEIMKALSDRLPEGVELSSWNYKREDGVRISGEADSANDVYKFKDLMIELGDDDRVFSDVVLTGPSAGKGGKQRFDIDCRYQGEDEE